MLHNQLIMLIFLLCAAPPLSAPEQNHMPKVGGTTQRGLKDLSPRTDKMKQGWSTGGPGCHLKDRLLSPRNLTGWQTYQCDWYKGGMKLLEGTMFIRIPSVPCTWAGCTTYTTIPTSQQEVRGELACSRSARAPSRAKKGKELPSHCSALFTHHSFFCNFVY